MRLRPLVLFGCLLLAAPRAAWPALDYSDGYEDFPPIVSDAQGVVPCTVAWLVTDLSTNDMTLMRMRIERDGNDKVIDGKVACPAEISPRMGREALEDCAVRAADPKTCVFADMVRDFDQQPVLTNTAENASRCASDKASDIGVACWHAAKFDVCAAACGDSPASAIASAVSRCESKHQRSCPVTGSAPVLPPQ